MRLVPVKQAPETGAEPDFAAAPFVTQVAIRPDTLKSPAPDVTHCRSAKMR
jgi:hypothetical protein